MTNYIDSLSCRKKSVKYNLCIKTASQSAKSLTSGVAVSNITKNTLRGDRAMLIHESAEDYLEAILILQGEKDSVHSIDVVNRLGFSKPSISVAMKRLRENGYITVAENGHISLTASGRKIAERIYMRHRVLTDVLVSIGVSEATAAADACKIEHDLSDESFQKIQERLGSSEGKIYRA